jgi:hypothetical protein
MQQLKNAVHSKKALKSDIQVENKVPAGFAHMVYEISGFNTAHNPLAPTHNGVRMRQSKLPIVFHSGLEGDQDDGVRVEALLAVCEDHLNTHRNTPGASDVFAEASSKIRSAIDLLVEKQASYGQN